MMNNVHIQKELMTIGKWGRLKKEYMMVEQPSLYQSLVDKNDLEKYLNEIEIQAENRMEFVMEELSKELGISDELKTALAMEQITKLHNVVLIAEEIVLNELIYI